MKNTTHTPLLLAILSAITYGISFPLSKLLLLRVPTFEMTSLLYAGSGLGMIIISLFMRQNTQKKEDKLGREDLPTIIWMIILNLAASSLLLIGIRLASAGTISLLSNFEIVATTVIARLLFKERLGKRVFVAIVLILFSSLLLSVADFSHFQLSIGALFALLACICWGAENNTTAILSSKDPLQIVIVKSLATAFFAIIIAFFTENLVYQWPIIVYGLCLGFVSYGLSLYFYITSQRYIGAIRTGAYFATAPFIGLILSWVMFGQLLTMSFMVAIILMTFGVYLVASETHVEDELT